MLIELTDEALAQGYELHSDAEWFWRGLSQLALAHRDGRHHLVAGHKLGQLLSTHPSMFDVYAYKTLKGLRATERRDAVGAAHIWVRVVAGQATKPAWEPAQGRPFVVSMDWFLAEAATRPSLLLVEGDDDGRVLTQVAAAWASSAQGRVCLEVRIGAGGNYLKVLGRVQDGQTMWFGVVDSDKTSMNAPLQSTAINAQATWRREGIGELRILEPRELENLMPRSLAHAVNDLVPSWKSAIAAVFSSERAPRYDDLKERVGDTFLSRCAEALERRSAQAVWRLLGLGEADELLQIARTAAEFGRAAPPTRT